MNSEKPTVLITGSSGRIGVAAAERLAERYQVVGFDIRDGHAAPAAEFVWVDLTSAESVTAALQQLRARHGERIASVIHLAAYYNFSGEPSPMYDKLTVQGTARLIRSLQEQAFKVEQFLFSSTMLVHAPCKPGQRIHEDWPVDPKWDYPASKVRTEDMLRSERGSIPLVIMRIAGVYNDRCNSIPIAHQIQRIYEKRMTGHVYPGNLHCGQAFVHMDDVIDALERAVERRGELSPEQTLLIGEPDTIGYGELQDALGQLIHGKDWLTARVPKPVAKVGAWVQEHIPGAEDPFIRPWMVDLADDHYELDISRARTALGWEPKHSLRDALPRMIEALKQDPAAWYRENGLEPSKIEEPAHV